MNSTPKGSKRNSSLSSVGGTSTHSQQQRKSAKSSNQLPLNYETKKQHQQSSSQRVKPSEHKRTSRKADASNLAEPTDDDDFHKKQQVGSWSSTAEYQLDDYRKQNHCEIEKRRRDKMNHYIMELASVIPSFSSQHSKYDKLTVLRMAVQHVKSLRSSLCSFSTFRQRPSFLSSGNLLKNLILQMASQEVQDNLFMVVTCDRGKVLFVSQSAKDILNQEQHELTGQCLFDILHKDDVSKVKEQISYYGMMPKEMLVDSKTLQKVKHNQRQSFSQMQNLVNSAPQPGARRSFFCRMRSGPNKQHLSFGSDLSQELVTQTSAAVDIAGKNQGACISELPNQSDNNGTVHESGEPRIGGAPRQTLNNLPGMRQCTDTVDSNAPNSHNRVENVVEARNDKSDKISEDERCKSKAKTVIGEIDTAPKTICRKSSSSSSSISSSSGPCSMDDGRNAGRSDEPSTSEDGISIGKRVNENTRNNTGLKASNNERGSGQVSKKHLRYIVMHCTGYLKAITVRNDEFDDNLSDNSSSDEEENERSRTVNCLVAVCRRSPIYRDLKPDRPLTFTCRYSMEGKFVFADQRTTVALGYTPQQLLGTSHYAYCHKDSVNTFKECHRQCILKSEAVSSDIYQFKRANGQNLWLQTSLKSFINPWTKFIDYIVASHTTAEGNEPHYNEGCVPTKFNQDMTGEAPQSSSPASSSSSSLPSMDSKKSSSPSSSSIGSSYSMESYASGGSIQALLNQIDRVKSGGLKHGPDFHRKKVVSRVTRSEGSGGKSSDDMRNFSDIQSCSSFSSQNSALYGDYANLQGVTNYVEGNNQSTVVNQNSTREDDNFYDPKSSQESCNPPKYQPMCQQLNNPEIVVNDTPAFGRTNTDTRCVHNEKLCTRIGNKLVKQTGGTVRQTQRPYIGHQYYYKNQAKSNSSLSSDTGNESAPLSNSSGSVYSDISAHRGRGDNQNVEVSQQTRIPNTIKNRHQIDICRGTVQETSCQPTFAIGQVDGTRMNIEPILVTNQLEGIGGCQGENNYTNQMINVAPYMSRDLNPQYNDSVDMRQVQQMHQQNDLQVNMGMTITEQQTVQRQEQPGSVSEMNVPMMWAPTENSHSYQNLNTMHAGTEQICKNGEAPIMNMDVSNPNNQMTAQQTVHCQQCANYRCTNRQSAMNNDADFNSINLTSLMVYDDLDEDQLLEYLATCEPESQLDHIQNNGYPQYNSYR